MIFNPEAVAAVQRYGETLVNEMKLNLDRRLTKHPGVYPSNAQEAINSRGNMQPYFSNTQASGTLANSLRVEVQHNSDELSMEIYGTDYWRNADVGVRPGETSYSTGFVETIKQWLIDKRSDADDIGKLAARIARRIADKGTIPQYSFFAQRVFTQIENQEPTFDVRALIVERSGIPQEIAGEALRIQRDAIELINKLLAQ